MCYSSPQDLVLNLGLLFPAGFLWRLARPHARFAANLDVLLLGLGLSALIVYLLPDRFSADRLDAQLTAYTWRFGLTAVLCELFFINFPVTQELSFDGFLTLSVAYTVLAIPFFCGGVCVALLMTHFSAAISRILYGADLLGASLGCLVVVAAMQIMPAPYVPGVVGVLGCVTALCMGRASGLSRVAMPAIALAVVGGLLPSAFRPASSPARATSRTGTGSTASTRRGMRSRASARSLTAVPPRRRCR